MSIQIPENYVPVRFLFPEKISAKIDFEMERIYKFAKANMISIKEVPNYIFTKYANSTQSLSKISIDLPDFIIKLAYKNQTFIKVSQETQEADDSGQWQKSLWAGFLSFIPGIGSLVAFTNMFRSSYPKCSASKSKLSWACGEFVIDAISGIADLVSLAGIIASVATLGGSLSVTVGATAAKIAAPMIHVLTGTVKWTAKILSWITRFGGFVFSILEKIFRWLKGLPLLSKAGKVEGWMKKVVDFFRTLTNVLEAFIEKLKRIILTTGSLPNAESLRVTPLVNMSKKVGYVEAQLVRQGGQALKVVTSEANILIDAAGTLGSMNKTGVIHLADDLGVVFINGKPKLVQLVEITPEIIAKNPVFQGNPNRVAIKVLRDFTKVEIKNNKILSELAAIPEKIPVQPGFQPIPNTNEMFFSNWLKSQVGRDWLSHDELLNFLKDERSIVSNASPAAQKAFDVARFTRGVQGMVPHPTSSITDALTTSLKLPFLPTKLPPIAQTLHSVIPTAAKLIQFSLNYSEKEQKEIKKEMEFMGNVIKEYIESTPIADINNPGLVRLIEQHTQIYVANRRRSGEYTEDELEEAEKLMRAYLYKVASSVPENPSLAKPGQRGYTDGTEKGTSNKKDKTPKGTSNKKDETPKGTSNKRDEGEDISIPDIVIPEL